ncbi:EAL domain-containing protein [Psychromonas sp. B3M02]|uniref:EAL domain-containing protein n=1 Tax=Psychromonas sp. B3M02 TaxID=2267226 RepID=UPI00215D7CB6|nr:EAL domain-containing protein [Psychromonas sp. B3M02]
MQFSIVAEGVETQEQLNYLAEKGCDYIQGFYFSPAIQAADIPGYLIQKAREI